MVISSRLVSSPHTIFKFTHTKDFDECRALLGVSIEQCKKDMQLVFEAKDDSVIILRKKVKSTFIIYFCWLTRQLKRTMSRSIQDPTSGAFLYRTKGVLQYPAGAFVASQFMQEVHPTSLRDLNCDLAYRRCLNHAYMPVRSSKSMWAKKLKV